MGQHTDFDPIGQPLQESSPDLRLIERMHERLEELRRLPNSPPGDVVEIIDDIEEGLRRLDRLQRELLVSLEKSTDSRSGSILVVDVSETDAVSMVGKRRCRQMRSRTDP